MDQRTGRAAAREEEAKLTMVLEMTTSRITDCLEAGLRAARCKYNNTMWTAVSPSKSNRDVRLRPKSWSLWIHPLAPPALSTTLMDPARLCPGQTLSHWPPCSPSPGVLEKTPVPSLSSL